MNMCPVCNDNTWNMETDSCNKCGITGMAITLGPSRMRRISKRFRYTNPKKLKKRRKHGRVAPSPARLVMNRTRLRSSEASQIATRHAAMLRTGYSTPKTAERRSEAQVDSGRP